MTFGTVTQAVTDQANLVDSTEDRKGSKSDSAYRTISEVAQDLNLPQHVLRFWESKFKQISPLKRGGGRRYYRPQDIDLIKRIHHLLHTQGYTIKGVQKLLVKDRQLTGSVTETPVEQQPARELNPVTKDILNRIAVTNPIINSTITQPSSASATGNQSDLKLILNRLKTLSAQMATRS